MAKRIFVILSLSVALFPPAVRAEIIHGFQVLQPTWVQDHGSIFGEYGFDFSTQTIVPLNSGSADVYCFEYYRNGSEWVASKDGNGVVVIDSLENVKLAPKVLSTGEFEGQVEFQGQVYDPYTFVFRTNDGLYAKFAVRSVSTVCCGISIEYYLQTDGTRSFDPEVAVEASTWGRVKALFR
jgi:hypothetical protein